MSAVVGILLVFFIVAVSSGVATPANGTEEFGDFSREEPLTSLSAFWELEPVAGDRVFPMRMRLEISFYHPVWRVLWVRDTNGGTFLDPGADPLPVRSGQVVDLDGFARPGRQQILWDQTAINVVEGVEPRAPAPWPETERDREANNLRVVEAEGLVVSQIRVDSHFERLVLAVGEQVVSVYLSFDSSRRVPVFEGAFVSMDGVFVMHRDGEGRPAGLELWVIGPERIELLSWLSDDERFSIDPVAIGDLPPISADTRVRIQGTVHALTGEDEVVVRDGTGQVRFQVLLRSERDLAVFLSDDPQGRRVLPFLDQLAMHLESERDGVRRELDSLRESVEHIKEIVSMQQTYAGGADLKENLPLADLVEDSLRIEGELSTRKGGHGFGLHSSALFAQEMGATLRVESDGAGFGARFILELPRYPNQNQT